jgi:hypothetical protein
MHFGKDMTTLREAMARQTKRLVDLFIATSVLCHALVYSRGHAGRAA